MTKKIVFVSILVGFILGICFAKFYWKAQYDAYIKAKHTYLYCPNCGELLKEN